MHTILKNQDAGGSLVIISYAQDIHTMRRNQQDIGLTLDYLDIVLIFSHITFIRRKTLYFFLEYRYIKKLGAKILKSSISRCNVVRHIKGKFDCSEAYYFKIAVGFLCCLVG